MSWSRKLVLGLMVLAAFSSLSVTYGLPSGDVFPPKFTLRYGEWYDSWGFNRNYYGGSDGYLPNVAYESLGPDKELAYHIGEQFKTTFPQKVNRAEAILAYVQRWTDYGYDEDNVYMNGVAQAEWAWNADEMAHMIDETTLSVAIGDCEDMAFLCSTIYLAAGFDVVLVSPPEHVALMIWLPEYDNANYYWDILDGRGYGWIWVEPTGEDNPLGWTPPDFTDGDFEVYLLSVISTVNYAPRDPQVEDDVTVTVSVSPQSSPISHVLLHYSKDGSVYKTLAMTLEGASYKATIPHQAEGVVVAFYVSATDMEGTVYDSGEFSYTVGGGWGLPDLEIPGFPWESIIIGLTVGLVALYYFAKKRSTLSMPEPSMV
jgi:hypothetical protein